MFLIVFIITINSMLYAVEPVSITGKLSCSKKEKKCILLQNSASLSKKKIELKYYRDKKTFYSEKYDDHYVDLLGESKSNFFYVMGIGDSKTFFKDLNLEKNE